MSKISYICQECGKEFTAYKSSKRKYCNAICANIAIGRKKKETRVELTCHYCDNKYKVIPFQVKRSKYCSAKCRDIHVGIRQIGENNPFYKDKITLTCINCNKKYEVHPYKKDISKYCSIECKGEYQKKSLKGKGNPHFGRRKYTDLEYQNWQEYRNKVRAETYANYKLYEDKINPKGLKIGRNKYHLDHKYSIHDGFHNDVPINIISHQYNLQILTCKENLKKNTKSCILLNDLEKIKNRS